MMLEKLRIIFSTLLILLLTTVYSYSELINPSKNITPKEVVEIQLNGLKQNDTEYKAVSYTHLTLPTKA